MSLFKVNITARNPQREELMTRALEGFGVMVDNLAHRFVATTTLVAAINP